MNKYKHNVRKKTHKKVIGSVKSYLSELHFSWATWWVYRTVLHKFPSLEVEFIFFNSRKQNLIISITKGGKPASIHNDMGSDILEKLISEMNRLSPNTSDKVKSFRHLTDIHSSLLIIKLIQNV